ncbi:TPA: helix-turn-helix domain-containing protein [Serratia marcescens]|nr:helix-turn-helix domain-containing protein [Serratia marcescens]
MKYIINGVATYNSLDCTLYCPDYSLDMVSLNRVTNELLLLFVQNNGVSLHRDMILNTLWESKGLSASSNNLNNHISMLRKALAQCGFPNLITTIPKHGFIFEADSIISVDEEPLAIPSAAVELTLSSRVLGRLLFSKKMKLMLVMLFILMISIYPVIYNYIRLQSLRTPLMSVEQCHFYLAGDKAKSMEKNEAIQVINFISKRYGVSCKSSANVYLFADNRMDAVAEPFVGYVLAMCPKESKLSCSNYYYNKYEG